MKVNKFTYGSLVKFFFVAVSLILVSGAYSAETVSNEILVKFNSDANKQIVESMPYGQLQIKGQSLSSNNVLGRLNATAEIISVEPVYKDFYKSLQTEISKGKNIDQAIGSNALDLSSYYKVKLVVGLDIHDVVDLYRENPDVEYVEPSYNYQASLVPVWAIGSDVSSTAATIKSNLLPEGLYKLKLDVSEKNSNLSSQEIFVSVESDSEVAELDSSNVYPPQFTFNSNVGVIKNKAYTWSFLVTDPEGASLYLVSPTPQQLPAGATVELIQNVPGTATVIFKWTPPMSYKKKTVVVPFSLSDGELVATRNLSITVR